MLDLILDLPAKKLLTQMNAFMRTNWYLNLFVAIFFVLSTPIIRAETVSIRVRAVQASGPGKSNRDVPEAIAHHAKILKESVYSTFVDRGFKRLQLASGESQEFHLSGYTLAITLISVSKGKAKVQLTFKKGDNPVGQPVIATISGEKSMTYEIGEKDTPIIFIFTLKE